MRLAALLGAILALVSAPAASGGEWALQTFVKVAQSDGSELLAELRHPCGASVEETTRSFCKDFDIAAPDCGLLAEFVEGLSPNTSWGICSGELGARDFYGKLGHFRLDVDDASTSEIRHYQIAIHSSDAVNIQDRVLYLCEQLGLIGDKCSILRRHLDEKAIQLQLDSIRNSLVQVAQGGQQGNPIEHAIIAYEGIINRLKRDRSQLQELVNEKAKAYRELQMKSQRELLDKALHIRLLEMEVESNGPKSHVPRPPGPEKVETDDLWVHSKKAKRIPRVAAASCSLSDYLQYARSSIPVIFTGLRNITNSPGLPDWTLDTLRASCGRSKAVTKTKSPHRDNQDSVLAGKRSWAGLEPAVEMTLAIFLDHLDKNPESNLYLHDINIETFCPSLLGSLSIPRFFANDQLQQVYSYTNSTVDAEEVGISQRDYWPSLFIGGKTTASALHADWGGTSAWMGLLQGRKHWVVASPSARRLLQEQVPTSSNPSAGRFNADLMQKFMNGDDDIEWADVLRDEGLYEDILEAGEVLFLPSECPHQVRNLDTTVAVAANFVDRGSAPNFAAYLRQEMLSSSGDKHRAFARILERLEGLQVLPPLSGDKDVSYREYKAQQLVVSEQ